MVAKPTATKLEPYELNTRFEQQVATLLCTSPKFYALVGRDLEFGRFTDPTAALAVRAAQSHAKDSGNGSTDAVLVIQRLESWRVEGTVTREQINDVIDMIDECECRRVSVDAVIAELVPAMRKVMNHEATLLAIDDSGKGKDLKRTEQLIHRAQNLGVQDRSMGTRLGMGVFSQMARARHADRLGTGILELDTQIDGGLPRGKIGMFMGGAKVGKSMGLVSQCSHALRNGLFTVYATLEMPEIDTNARLIANLTGVPTNAIIDGSMEREATDALEPLLPTLGRFDCKFFPADVTTVPQIIEWVSECEQEAGRKVDLFVLDYIDKVRDHRAKSEYEVQNNTTEAFRLYVHGRGLWGWTASQVRRLSKESRNKRVDENDSADSMGKARVTDLLLTAHRPSDFEIEFYVAASRFCKDRFGVGPYAHDFDRARIVAPIVA